MYWRLFRFHEYLHVFGSNNSRPTESNKNARKIPTNFRSLLSDEHSRADCITFYRKLSLNMKDCLDLVYHIKEKSSPNSLCIEINDLNKEPSSILSPTCRITRIDLNYLFTDLIKQIRRSMALLERNFGQWLLQCLKCSYEILIQ